MYVKNNTSYGKINTSVDFIKQVAAMSAMECFGVVGMSKKSSADDIIELLKKENLGKGVKINFTQDNKLSIDLYVIMEFGVKIPAVAENLIDTVKYNVEKQTGLKIKKINVYVQCVRA
jgi:uncharacterized alkaline shock family protein YloU